MKEKENDNAVLIKEASKEIASLHRQLGGLKTSNANYRDQVETLKAQVKHYKQLDIEGDELYERKIAECEQLQQQLAFANHTIDELQAQIASYNDRILEYKDRMAEDKAKIEDLCTAMEDEQKPWWKKIF